jgi:hypothetical protein
MARRADVLSRFSAYRWGEFIVVTVLELIVLSWARDNRWTIGKRLNLRN